MNKKLLLLFAALLVASANAQFKASAFDVDSLKLIEDLKTLQADQKLSPETLAEKANSILQTDGVPYKIYFDAATCDKIRNLRNTAKDPKAPIKLSAKLQSIGAEQASLALPSPQFGTGSCAECYLVLPLLEITAADFVVLVQGRNLKFSRPGNFLVSEVVSLDTKTGAAIKRWKVPSRSEPIGISGDGNVIYLAFDDAALSELALAIFSEGVFEIVTRKEAVSSGKPKAEAAPAGYKTARFTNGGGQFVLRYPEDCK